MKMKDNLVRKWEKGKEETAIQQRKKDEKNPQSNETQGAFRITTKPEKVNPCQGQECWSVAGRQMKIYIFKRAGGQDYNHI